MAVKVLIIEDDNFWLKTFKLMIGNKVDSLFTFTEATTLDAALLLLKGQQYSLVLLDLFLPDSEPEATLKVFSAYADIVPIVVLTCLDDEKFIIDSFKHGVEDYILKDQYDLKTFTHVCLRAIQRFTGRQTADLSKNI